MHRITGTTSRLRPGLHAGASKRSPISDEARLPLGFRARRPEGRLVLLVEPAVDEGPDKGAGRDTAPEALAAQPRVDAFIEAHRHRLSQGSHLRPQPYTSQPPPATADGGQAERTATEDKGIALVSLTTAFGWAHASWNNAESGI
jgi:hypothetical protein